MGVEIGVFIEAKLLLYISNCSVYSLDVFLYFGTDFAVINLTHGLGQIMHGLSQLNQDQNMLINMRIILILFHLCG